MPGSKEWAGVVLTGVVRSQKERGGASVQDRVYEM